MHNLSSKNQPRSLLQNFVIDSAASVIQSTATFSYVLWADLWQLTLASGHHDPEEEARVCPGVARDKGPGSGLILQVTGFILVRSKFY